jgi:2-dehydropantoate 2-reductase
MSLKPYFLIYGVGAVGGMYGAQLLTAKNQLNLNYDLAFIARNQTYQVLKDSGIKFHVCNDDASIDYYNSETVTVYKDLEHCVSPTDNQLLVILLCVKSKDTQDAANKIFDFTKKNSLKNFVVISIQNGVENEEILAAKLGVSHVIGAYTNVLAEVIAPGDYMRKGSYWLTLGELDQAQLQTINEQNRIDYLQKIFTDAQLVIKQSQDIEADLWEKLVWNAAFNPLSVLYEADIRTLLDDEKIRLQIKNIMKETKDLALFLGIKVDPEIDIKHFNRTDALNLQGFKTSMLQDFLRKRPLELDQLLGVVVRKAKANGFLVPYCEQLFNDLQHLC